MIVGIFSLIFFTINIPEAAFRATLYWSIALTALVVWSMSKLLMGKKGALEFPNPIIYEDYHLFGKYSKSVKVGSFIAIFLIAAYIFFSISTQTSAALVAAPNFQALPLTTETNVLLTAVAATIEDVTFFGIIAVLIGGFVYFLSRNKWAGFAVALLVTPLIFTGYHLFVYGENIPALTNIFFFGLFGTALVLITKNLWFSMIHIANNEAVAIFSKIGLGGLDIYFYSIVIITLAIAGWYMVRTRNRGD